MAEQYNIIMIINSQGLDTSCIGNVHRLPFIKALNEGIAGKGKLLIVTAPTRFHGQKMQKKEENINLFTPYMPLPISLAERWRPALKLYRWCLNRELNNLLGKLDFLPETRRILWVTHPFHIHYLGLINEDSVIYDCYDDFSLLGCKVPNDQIKNAEVRLAKKSNIILAVSQVLAERLIKINPNTYYFPNAVDFELFNKALNNDPPIAQEIEDIPKPIIGFTGNIFHHSIDFDLIYEVINKNRNWSFVFIGQIDKTKKEYSLLKRFSNIYFLGWKDYYELPDYLRGFDAAILPYKVDEFMKSANPNKLYQYMAAGIPIVSTAIPEVMRFDGLVGIGKGITGFVEAIRRVLLKKDTEIVRQLVLTAAENSWEKRVEMVLDLLKNKL